jgi:hypothetical protein
MNAQIKTLNSGTQVVVIKTEQKPHVGTVYTCRRFTLSADGSIVPELGTPLRLPADCFQS